MGLTNIHAQSLIANASRHAVNHTSAAVRVHVLCCAVVTRPARIVPHARVATRPASSKSFSLDTVSGMRWAVDLATASTRSCRGSRAGAFCTMAYLCGAHSGTRCDIRTSRSHDCVIGVLPFFRY